jgi:NADH-quinone oxidoreductase subunit L
MVCRLSPMFITSEVAMTVVTYVGAATCIFACATVGLRPERHQAGDRLSTCSQLGYMFFAAGSRSGRRCSTSLPTPSSRRLLFSSV